MFVTVAYQLPELLKRRRIREIRWNGPLSFPLRRIRYSHHSVDYLSFFAADEAASHALTSFANEAPEAIAQERENDNHR